MPNTSLGHQLDHIDSGLHGQLTVLKNKLLKAQNIKYRNLTLSKFRKPKRVIERKVGVPVLQDTPQAIRFASLSWISGHPKKAGENPFHCLV